MSPPNPRDIETLIIHCSATPNGRWVTAEEIDRWHGARGFQRDPRLGGFNQPRLRHIGYHFVIYTTGAVVTGRGLREAGAHAYGNNARSIGTCLIGTDKFTPAQWAVLRRHVELLLKRHPSLHVIGHREVDPAKTCPGFAVQTWLAGDMAPPAGHVLEGAHG